MEKIFKLTRKAQVLAVLRAGGHIMAEVPHAQFSQRPPVRLYDHYGAEVDAWLTAINTAVRECIQTDRGITAELAWARWELPRG